MRSAILLLLLATLGLSGCQATGRTSFEVESDRYAAVFREVEDLLRDEGFELERIDARAGVITTRPLPSSGVWTPWVSSERTLEAEIQSSLHRERRVVEVRFLGEAPDRRLEEGPIRLDVEARIQRLYQPGVRTSPASVRLRHIAEDPALELPRDERVFAVAHSADRSLASFLTIKLAERLDLELEQRESLRRKPWRF